MLYFREESNNVLNTANNKAQIFPECWDEAAARQTLGYKNLFALVKLSRAVAVSRSGKLNRLSSEANFKKYSSWIAFPCALGALLLFDDRISRKM